MSCSTAKSSTASRKHRSSSSNGAGTTTRSDRAQPSDIDHPRHKRSTRSCHRWIRSNICNNLPTTLVQKNRQATGGRRMNGRALAFTVGAFVLSGAASESATAQPIVHEEVRLSQLTLSAFDCSLLTEDSKEAHRLFEVGFTAGRAFLNGINNLTKAERGQVSGKIDPLWQHVWDGGVKASSQSRRLVLSGKACGVRRQTSFLDEYFLIVQQDQAVLVAKVKTVSIKSENALSLVFTETTITMSQRTGALGTVEPPG